MEKKREDCPCKRACKRHGDCSACQLHHKEKMKYAPACQRRRKKKNEE